MNKKILGSVLIFFSSLSFAAIKKSPSLLISHAASDGTEIKSILIQEARVSENCADLRCEALKAAALPEKEQASADLLDDENEKAYCTHLGGRILESRLSSGSPMNFCQFKDGSFISSWYLVN